MYCVQISKGIPHFYVPIIDLTLNMLNFVK